MDKTKALQNLLKGKATKKEIELLKQALASGEISIGGDVQRSIVIMGDGNSISLTPEALDLLKPEKKKEEPVKGEPPYMGLRYFDTQDAYLFYGREALTRELLGRVQKESFLAIVGASGSGKSSVARAGLIPAWQKENGRNAIHVITPTAHPLESLAASLTRESESVTATSTLMDDLRNDPRSLRLYVKKALGETKLLLLVDQFEETFTLCKDADERKAFIENLLSLADDDGAARVVITLRADFYHHCATYESLRHVLEGHQKYIGVMSQDELREAIIQPSENNGWKFQDGLVEQILQDVGMEPGALPLLSHALLETWKRRQGRTLTLQGYHEAGGVKKAIAQTAESVYDKLTPVEQTIARGIFLRLTELGEGVQDTRRRVKLDELAQKEQESVAKVLKILTDARLITTEQDSAELAHEALIREWGTLRKWLDEDRESLRLHRHLTESAGEWQSRGKEASELYRGARLKGIKEWMKKHSDLLSPLEGEFLKASQNVKKREWLGWATISSLALLLVFLAQTGQFNRLIYHPVGMDEYWVLIPAGQFIMGSENGEANEKPHHTIYLESFEIGRHEITQGQYEQCIKAGVCTGLSGVMEERKLYPAVNVAWYDAKAYCEWVGGRLPNEAEWEKAATWDDTTKQKRTYPWGETIDCTYANFYNTGSGGYCEEGTVPVESYKKGRSAYGLYDMLGNVMEWTSSANEPYPYNINDGREDMISTKSRVIRDTSYYYNSEGVHSTLRGWESPDYTSNDLGFRCARNIDLSYETGLITTANALIPTSTKVGENWLVIVQDTFDDNRNNWRTGEIQDDYSTQNIKIDDGIYSIFVKAEDGTFISQLLSGKSVANFILKADVKIVDGPDDAKIGLIFRQDAIGNFYVFEITNDGYFRVLLLKEGQWVYLIEETRIQDFKINEVNHLSVIAFGSEFIFYINDDYVGKAIENSITEGSVGFVIEIAKDDQVNYEFDNFILQAP